jgi:transcriptional regulator NrdR family protein
MFRQPFSGTHENGVECERWREMKCPDCGSIILHVYQTQHFENEIIRRRICENQHKFRTVEVIADVVKVKNGEPEVTVSADRFRIG